MLPSTASSIARRPQHGRQLTQLVCSTTPVLVGAVLAFTAFLILVTQAPAVLEHEKTRTEAPPPPPEPLPPWVTSPLAVIPGLGDLEPRISICWRRNETDVYLSRLGPFVYDGACLGSCPCGAPIEAIPLLCDPLHAVVCMNSTEMCASKPNALRYMAQNAATAGPCHYAANADGTCPRAHTFCTGIGPSSRTVCEDPRLHLGHDPGPCASCLFDGTCGAEARGVLVGESTDLGDVVVVQRAPPARVPWVANDIVPRGISDHSEHRTPIVLLLCSVALIFIGMFVFFIQSTCGR